MQANGAAEFEILIVGGGVAGIGMGIRLRQEGFHDFAILEGDEDVGGTWRDNVYPGVAVDIPSFTYCFSFEPNPHWSRIFAPGREIKAYADHCVEKYGLRPHIRFGTRVDSARFDTERKHWRVRLTSGETLTARTVISATGLLTQPKMPGLPGLESFEGDVVHSARWRDDLSFEGKRIAVIGTGATGVQLVPALARRVKEMTVFQRTPIWVLPKLDARVPPTLQTLFSRLPASQRLARLLATAGTEVLMVLAIVYHRQFPFLAKTAEAIVESHLRASVKDPELRRKLTPAYGFGCKRPSFSNRYYRTFEKPHVQLETAGIRGVTPEGIVTADGRTLAFDAIICATGFRTYEKGNLPTYQVFGRDGTELSAFWEASRYQAYQGASVPGYPNFFMMIGPYSATGSSWFAMVENQAEHVLRCLKGARKRNASLVEVRQNAHDAYFREVQARQRNTVFFNNACGASNSYYFDQHGDALFYRPASGVETYFQSRLFPLDHYQFS